MKKIENETLDQTEALFVLAVGEVGRKIVEDARINLLAVIELQKKLPNLKNIYFVGGKSENSFQNSISRDTLSYFQREIIPQSELDFGNIKLESLEQSNNTVGNIEEIQQELRINNVCGAILTNSYHTKRVKIILKRFNMNYIPVVGSDDLVSAAICRDKLWHYFVETAKERVLTILLRFDPNYKTIKKWREFKRKNLV